MASFPTSAKSFTTRNAGDIIQPAHVNDLQDEVNAIEATLLTNGGFTPLVNSVKFPAAQSASSDANTLDDYEEGSWTPVIGGSGGTSGQVYTTQVGRYVKIGKLVTVQFGVALSTEGTITGNVEIQGLPFTAENTSNLFGVCAMQWVNLATTWVYITGVVDANTAVIAVRGASAAAATSETALTATDIGNTSTFRGTMSYRATA